jgi:hypothetical protein
MSLYKGICGTLNKLLAQGIMRIIGKGDYWIELARNENR